MKNEETKELTKVVNARIKESVKTNWQDALELTKQNTVKATYENHKLIFENSEAFKDKTIKLNEFTHRIEYCGTPLTTTFRSIIRNDFERVAGFRNPAVTDDFLYNYSYLNKYNPIIDYLNSIRNKRREDIKCKDVFIKWFKAQETPHRLIEKLSEKWFVSGIKRIFEPGCDIEGMIYVFGKTGTGKSTFVHRLAKGFDKQYIGDIENTQKLCEVMNQSWIVNFDEMKSLVKKDSNAVKEFLTTPSDTVRLAYRTDAEEYFRHCIFFGSTNNPDVLKDYSGDIERRFWPIISLATDKQYIWNNFTDDIADAIWADALYIYENNKDYNVSTSDLTDIELNEMMELQKQCKTYYNDDSVDLIREILNRRYKLNNAGEFDNLEDFKHQVSDTDISASGQITYIPISYLNVVLQVYYHTSRKNNWIAAALSDDWVYRKKLTKFAGNCMCLIRKGYDTDLF